jgi:hypothetical protein
VVGINIWNEHWISPAAQDAAIRQMAEGGVRIIRTGLIDYNIDFIIKAYRQGISSGVIVGPTAGSNAKSKGTWSQIPLSGSDPAAFTDAIKPMRDKLETAGVRLAAFELGNEINTSRFNGDIADPGSERELGLEDLNNRNDAEGQAVANGYRTYLKVLAALKRCTTIRKSISPRPSSQPG